MTRTEEIRKLVHEELDRLPNGRYVKTPVMATRLGLPKDQATLSAIGRTIADYPRSVKWGTRRPVAYVLEGDL